MSRFLPGSHLEASPLLGEGAIDYWPEALALTALLVVFGLTAGPVGVLVGLLTAAVWYALGTPYAFAVGHVGIVVAFSDGIDPLMLALLEVPFVALLLAPLVRHHARVRAIGVALTVVLAGSALVWVGTSQLSLSVTVLLVLGFLVIVSYGIHRLELVRLGLVRDDRDRTARETATEGRTQ